MSKVRREKHKRLVFDERVYKYISRAITLYNRAPRWRQWELSENERTFKK